MKDFVRYNWYFTKTNMTTFINGLFFYLRKLPLVGKKIPVEIFTAYGFKNIVSTLISVVAWALTFPAKFLWLFSYIYLGMVVFSTKSPMIGGFLWLMVVGFITCFFNGFIYTVEKKQLNFVKFYQISGAHFYRGKMLYELLIRNVIGYLPAFLVLQLIEKTSFLFSFNLILTYAATTLFGLYWDRFFFKHQLPKSAKTISGWVLLGLLLALTGGVLYFDQTLNFMHYYLTLPVTALLLAAALLCSWKILTYKEEYAYIQNVSNRSSAAYDKAEQTNRQQHLAEGLQLQEKMKLTDASRFSQLRGSNYLNALLFDRFKDGLYKSLRFRLILIFGCGMLLTLAVRFFHLSLNEKAMYRLLPYFFILVYFLSMGKKIVQMCFINCDSSMLHYPFYREASTIRTGLTFRLIRSFTYNAFICGSLLLMILAVTLIGGVAVSMTFYIVTTLLLLSLALFFSFHQLFVYYLLQPFTNDSSVVNPVYKGVDLAVYFFAYFNMQLRFTSILYLVSVSIITILYVVIGYFIIQKKAPQTFRMK